jgi:hypothetical protein
MQGRSLAPWLVAAPPVAAPPPRLLPAEGYSIQGVRGDDWKVTRRDATLSVVAVSPAGVESPVAQPAPSQTEEAFAAVARECERARSVLGGVGLTRPLATNVGADPERERKLRALGYID